MSAAFTPGPWSIDGFSLVVGPDPKDGQYRVVADCRSSNARANANLIAVAPELYTALETIAALTSGHRQKWAREAWETALDALAKARGEQVSA